MAKSDTPTNHTVITTEFIPHESSGRFSLRRTLMTWRRALLRKLRIMHRRLTTPLSPVSTTAYVRNAILVTTFGVYVIYYPLEVAFFGHDVRWMKQID